MPDSRREQLRREVLRNAAAARPARPARSRRGFVLAGGAALAGAVAFGYGLWEHGTTAVLAAVRFEVRLAEDTPVPGLVVAQFPPGVDRVLYLHPEIVVSNDDIAQTWVTEEGPDQFAIGVQFLPAGAARMRQATAAHVGRPIAVLLNGIVVMAPVVKSPIGDSAAITGHFSRTEAEKIADGMKLR